MKNRKFITLLFVTVLTAMAAAETQGQQANQTYVNSLKGSNENPQDKMPNTCTDKMNPCKTIAYAYARTKIGGTITLLYASELDTEGTNQCTDPYDMVIIDKEVTIRAAEGLGKKPCFLLTPTAYPAVEITKSNNTVRLIGLRFVGAGGSVGVSFKEGAGLDLEQCYFDGVYHGLTVKADAPVDVTETKFRTAKGIILSNATHPQRTSISNSEFIRSGDVGLMIGANRRVVLKNSLFTDVDSAIWVYSDAELDVDDQTRIHSSGTAIEVMGAPKSLKISAKAEFTCPYCRFQ